jgi:hypothetical protein
VNEKKTINKETNIYVDLFCTGIGGEGVLRQIKYDEKCNRIITKSDLLTKQIR